MLTQFSSFTVSVFYWDTKLIHSELCKWCTYTMSLHNLLTLVWWIVKLIWFLIVNALTFQMSHMILSCTMSLILRRTRFQTKLYRMLYKQIHKKFLKVESLNCPHHTPCAPSQSLSPMLSALPQKPCLLHNADRPRWFTGSRLFRLYHLPRCIWTKLLSLL